MWVVDKAGADSEVKDGDYQGQTYVKVVCRTMACCVDTPTGLAWSAKHAELTRTSFGFNFSSGFIFV